MTLRGTTKNAKGAKARRPNPIVPPPLSVPSASSRTGAGKVRLGDVCVIEFGTRIRSKDSKSNDYPVYGGGGKTFGWETYNRENQCVVSRFAMSPECVRMVRGKFFLNDSGLTVSVKEESALQEYIDCFLLGSQDKIYSLGRGCAQKNLRVDGFRELPIPLPPLPTQQRIADELDQLCALKKNAEDRLAILDQIVKSRFVEMFGDLKVNNKGWRIGSVSDVAAYWNGLTYKPEHVTEDGVIVLRSSNVQNGVIDLKDLVRVSLVAKEKNIVQAGDVLMCSRNGSAALVGKTAIIPKGLPKMYFGAFMMIVRGKYPEFLSSFFATRYFRDQIACGKTSTVNQITCSMMNQVRLPIPPEELMREFAAFVSEVDKSKVTLRETVATLDQLYRAKLQEYFG